MIETSLELYQSSLGVGIDVDWCKTNPGRSAIKRARADGLNIPLIFKNRGFGHARIRVAGDVCTEPELLEEIRLVVYECLEAGLVPIVAYQAEEFKTNPDSDEAIDKVVSWWQKVNELFPRDLMLGLNLIIETNGDKLRSSNWRLNFCYQLCADAIAEYSGCRVLICAPNDTSNPYELPNLLPPIYSGDVMAEWHFYAAGPSRTAKGKKWTTGTAEERQLIANKVQYAKDWAERTQIPTWVGAWMAADYNDEGTTSATHPDGAPASSNYLIAEQIEFSRAMVGYLDAAGIPYAINSDTKYFDREENAWYESVENVLDVILGE